MPGVRRGRPLLFPATRHADIRLPRSGPAATSVPSICGHGPSASRRRPRPTAARRMDSSPGDRIAWRARPRARRTAPRYPRARRDSSRSAGDSHAPVLARTGTAPAGRMRSAWSCPRCPAGWREWWEGSARMSPERDVRRPHAHRLVAPVGAAVGVVRRPARLVLEQTDRPDVAVGAEIEPVMGAVGDAQQITGLHFDRDDRTLARMDVEQAAPANDEAHFVFVVPVLHVEFREHGVEAGGGGGDVDDIRGHVAAARLELCDLGRVGLQDGFRRSIDRHALLSRPVLIIDLQRLEVTRHLVLIGDRPLLRGASYGCHVMPRYRPILRVLDDREPFTVLIRADAVEPLEHLIAFDHDAPVSGGIGENRAPDRVRMQYGACPHAARACDCDMQPGFGRRFSRAATEYTTGFINLHDLTGV